MNNEYYWVISCSEDGDVRIEPYSKPILLRGLKEKWWGQPLENIPYGGIDPQDWGNRILIIKGSQVVPFEKEIVTEYDII